MAVTYHLYLDGPPPTEWIILTAPDLVTRPDLDFTNAPSAFDATNGPGVTMLDRLVSLPDAFRPAIVDYLSWLPLQLPGSTDVPFSITLGMITQPGTFPARTILTSMTTAVTDAMTALGIGNALGQNGEIWYDASGAPTFIIPSSIIGSWPALWTGPTLIP